MNERKLYETWRSFALKNCFQFISNDDPHFQGVISEISIQKNNKTLILARIGKTGSGYQQKWTKVFFHPNEALNHSLKIKNKWITIFLKKTILEKIILRALQKANAAEVKINETNAFIKFNHILGTEDEILLALNLKSKVKQLLTPK